MRSILTLATLFALVVLPGVAAAQTVTLVVDKPIVGVGGMATVEVVVEGGTGIAGTPTLPSSNGYALGFAGQSSQFQMARGSVSQSVTFQYQLQAKTVGDWTVGPAEVTVGGKKLKSAQLELKVVKGGGASAGSGGAVPAGAQHYARASVSDPTPYVGEAFSWVLEVGSTTRVRQPSLPSLPDFGGLSSEPGIDPQWTTRRQMQDGRRVEVFIAALPVFAVEPGNTSVGAAQVNLPEVVRGGFMGPITRDVVLQAKAVPVRVRPLPAGKPADYSGAVGRFGLSTAVDTTTVRAGETVTMTLRLDGPGALRAPEVTLTLPESVRAYDEEPDVQVSLVDGQVHSRAVFRRALVPLEPGTLTIPPATFTYLDPDSDTYRTARSKAVRVTVTGEAVNDPTVARSEGLAASKEKVEILGSDILPLRTGDRLLGSQIVGLSSPLVLALLLLPLLGFGGVAVSQARSRAADSDRGRRAARGKEAKAAEKEAKAAGSAGDADGAEKAMRAWLSARMKRSGASLSAGGEAKDALLAEGAPPELAARLDELLARIEGVRYGGESPAGLADDLATWVADAAKEWR